MPDEAQPAAAAQPDQPENKPAAAPTTPPEPSADKPRPADGSGGVVGAAAGLFSGWSGCAAAAGWASSGKSAPRAGPGPPVRSGRTHGIDPWL
ncbi:hypothetical protein [Streptomyces beijiangensis]|uniref:Uncharacterized protein n=1 Tax=Streptomyces beijiangensis TaxID=163361 RepID=A0A939FI06_9ACTN|nr:hypothetical protein [Streptomyces beijiangensis]MBO0517500.1 hypothetical protein [Streptomyces beijiangensis]